MVLTSIQILGHHILNGVLMDPEILMVEFMIHTVLLILGCMMVLETVVFIVKQMVDGISITMLATIAWALIVLQLHHLMLYM